MIDKFRLIEWVLMIVTIIVLTWFSLIAFEAKGECERMEKICTASRPNINITQILPKD